jgi:hypothetical protein
LKTRITVNIENTKAVKTVVSEQFGKLTVTLVELLVSLISQGAKSLSFTLTARSYKSHYFENNCYNSAFSFWMMYLSYQKGIQ